MQNLSILQPKKKKNLFYTGPIILPNSPIISLTLPVSLYFPSSFFFSFPFFLLQHLLLLHLLLFLFLFKFDYGQWFWVCNLGGGFGQIFPLHGWWFWALHWLLLLLLLWHLLVLLLFLHFLLLLLQFWFDYLYGFDIFTHISFGACTHTCA